MIGFNLFLLTFLFELSLEFDIFVISFYCSKHFNLLSRHLKTATERVYIWQGTKMIYIKKNILKDIVDMLTFKRMI